MVIIIGAGLSGLLTAYRLKQAGIALQILEARDRIGGRIFTKEAAADTPVEMGATWFNQAHIHLQDLLKELDLPHFEQYMEGKAFFETNPAEAPEAFDLPRQAPSYRIAGGSSKLIQKLRSFLREEEVLTGQPVQKVEVQANKIKITAQQTFEGERLVLALPPRIIADQISFSPGLPADLRDIASRTHTWMEDSVKVALVYKQAFWKENQLSGTLFSNSGPLTEFYDHSNAEASRFALCGFMHPAYQELSFADRQARIITQLSRILGEEAANFIDYQEVRWSKEAYTHSPSSVQIPPHQYNGHPVFSQGFFDHRVFISNAETSPLHGGYMDGAVHSANRISERLIRLSVENNP